MEQAMTANETARLIDWLENRGVANDEILQCIKYIATGVNQEGEKKQEEKK